MEHIHNEDTSPQRHNQSKSDEACCLSLNLWLIATRFFLPFSGLVRLPGLCSQVCPLASFQKTNLSDPGRTCSGPTPFLAMSYSAASAGYNDCSELQMQAFLLAQQGQPVLRPMRLRGAAAQVRLAFRALGTDPVHQLGASCRDLVRIKTCSPISLKSQTPALQGACSLSSWVVCSRVC